MSKKADLKITVRTLKGLGVADMIESAGMSAVITAKLDEVQQSIHAHLDALLQQEMREVIDKFKVYAP
ncbi:TPA: hypothetical protein ACH3X1_011676 [Trebouxia sp. C0004]